MLLDLWNSARSQLAGKHVKQVIGFAGNGHLLEGNSTSREFREYLRAVPSDVLTRHAVECLETKFDDSGLALQDLVNEIGSRLGFAVEPGRYRGKAGQLGHDGLWRTAGGDALVVEIKTTTAYSIDLDVVAKYRRALIESGSAREEFTSILLVVGRFDTGGWEAQTRGSRHSWLLRLISVDALIRLLRIKEQLDDPQVVLKIREILKPHEYTRVDGIIDLVFSAAADLQQPEEPEPPMDARPRVGEASEGHAEHAKPQAFHAESVALVERALGVALRRAGRYTWVSPDGATAVQCSVSKRHEGGAYWFAFHPRQKEHLGTFQRAYLALGCGSAGTTLLVPLGEVLSWLDKTWMTQLEDRSYWHVKISDTPVGLELLTKSGIDRVPLQKYLVASTA